MAQVDWYVPTQIADADASLSWNSSVLGGFDPWTKKKVTLLFQYHSLALDLPEAEGMMDLERGDGTKGTRQYPGGAYEASYPGVRLENGNWSIAFAPANGTIRWNTVQDLGRPLEMQAKTYEAIIARGFGAWAVLDTASDIRLGFSWPELYVRLVYGKFELDQVFESVHFGIAGAGVSLLGIRMTIGDLLFAEVRAGDYSINTGVSFMKFAQQPGAPSGADAEDDILIQKVSPKFELRPMFRIGFAL
jgi:hypothetical protein